MSGYGSCTVAHVETVTLGPGIAEYLARIDATLEPFGGPFLVHGARAEVVEGPWRDDLVVPLPVRVLGRKGGGLAHVAVRSPDAGAARAQPRGGSST